ncbi:MAG TPA: hypothetical protein VJS39_01760 [Gemmatimonadaceae bacterium]|nr:hypothetical protein [Gemmatimonadaceae bacterium]
MRQYITISGLFLTLVALAQLTRFLFQWPVVVDGVTIPTWLSLIAAIIVGSLAVWAFRVRPRTA